ncbi:hypothetical protein NQ314_009767 [Rhamnusium bicolor]|uniref:Uncharacterized protein n=1 Tax=Rhamnusium bicolor TaxID=1586634 RepID=A0AAV8XX39_9CUCU|nr:hypothetical protein NQ314_009767 [Rhamnusium bicolor]
MKAFFAFLAILAAANAGILAPTAGILQGPSSITTLVGPEGRVISSVAPGGQVISKQISGAIAYSAPLLARSPVVSAYTAPAVVAPAAPILSAYLAPVSSAYSAPVLSAYSAPAVRVA